MFYGNTQSIVAFVRNLSFRNLDGFLQNDFHLKSSFEIYF